MVRKALGLTNPAANRVRDDLAADKLLDKAQAGRTITFALTDAGRAFLDRHRAELPPPKGFKPPSNDRVRDLRTSYLLLQVLRAEPGRLRRSAANTFDALGKKLDLNAVTADELRSGLAARGVLAVTGSGTTAEFALTPAGRAELGSAVFDEDTTFAFTGKTLNALLETAREVGKQDLAAEPAPPAPRPAVTPDDLDRAIAAAFDDLLQNGQRAVPIHAVRAAVAESLGPDLATSAAFNESVVGLSKAGRFRAFPITDLSRATPEELRASIPGLGETLFYLEAVRDPVPAG